MKAKWKPKYGFGRVGNKCEVKQQNECGVGVACEGSEAHPIMKSIRGTSSNMWILLFWLKQQGTTCLDEIRKEVKMKMYCVKVNENKEKSKSKT